MVALQKEKQRVIGTQHVKLGEMQFLKGIIILVNGVVQEVKKEKQYI